PSPASDPAENIPADKKEAGEEKNKTAEKEHSAKWGSFFLLVAVGALFGFVYAALMHFLPRYLDDTGLRPESIPEASFRNRLTALVLVCGAVGQGVSGWLSRPGRLQWLLVAVLAANAPCLLWMAFAEGQARLWATGVVALVHFMNQPVYNSLIASYVPPSRRSVSYGFSNLACFGFGSLGPSFAGWAQTLGGTESGDHWTYGILAGIALLAALLAAVLWRWNPPLPDA
ncbi:MAG: MFS transporter, partial [Planctomycetales bacterium]